MKKRQSFSVAFFVSLNFDMRYSVFIFWLLSSFVFSQDSITKSLKNLKFREDHFYMGIFFNTFIDKPADFSQSKLSPGFQLGYLRDIPVNSNRKFAIAPGLGLSYVSNNLNLLITEQNQNHFFSIGSPGDFSKNRLTFFSLDFPIEFRWRNATSETFHFFRIYSGFKISYIFNHFYINQNSESTTRLRNIDELQRWGFGAYIVAGYNTWNLYLYYGLNRIFGENLSGFDNPIRARTLSLGLQFYIL